MYLQQTLSKPVSFLAINFLLSIAFIIIHGIHFTLMKVDVILYDALIDVAVTALLCTVVIFSVKKYINLSKLEIFLTISGFCMAGYIYAITVPTIIDRSLSIYILEKIHQNNGQIREDAIEKIFQEYITEHRLVDVRLTEQMESGTIIIDGECIKLTRRGKRVVYIANLYRTKFLPKKRLLMGEYTDQLKDPLKHSGKKLSYSCN